MKTKERIAVYFGRPADREWLDFPRGKAEIRKQKYAFWNAHTFPNVEVVEYSEHSTVVRVFYDGSIILRYGKNGRGANSFLIGDGRVEEILGRGGMFGELLPKDGNGLDQMFQMAFEPSGTVISLPLIDFTVKLGEERVIEGWNRQYRIIGPARIKFLGFAVSRERYVPIWDPSPQTGNKFSTRG